MLDATRKRLKVQSYVYWLQTNPRSRPYSPKTVETYKDQVGLFERWAEDQGLSYDRLTKDDLLDHFADLTAEGKKPTSISLRHCAVRSFYEYLNAQGLASHNPAAEIPFRLPPRDSGQPYTDNEVRRLYQACRNYQERAVFMVLLGTGIRRSEVFRISRDDCNFEAGTIRVLRKGGQWQYIQPEPAVMHALETALEFNDRLCPQKSDDYVCRLIKRLAARAGIPGRHHPHRLRFTFSVAWCEAGGQESELQMALGHSSPNMTAYYSKVGRERRAMRTMSTIGIATRLLSPVAGA